MVTTRSRRRLRVCLVSLAALIAAGGAVPVFAQTQPSTDQTQTQTPPTTGQKTDDKTGKDKKPADKSTTVKGVVVTADQPAVRSDIDRRSYDISKDLQAQSGASLADALRNVPSVDVDLNGTVSLRGDTDVQITVDGKPSTLFKGPGAGQALQTIPAGQYERVEVMTNPSAAFSPQGSAGIINLITKKTHKAGTSGSVRANIGSSERWNAGFDGTLQTETLTANIDFSASHNVNGQSKIDHRQLLDGSGAVEQLFNAGSQFAYASDGHFGHAGVDWRPDAKTQVSSEVNIYGFRNSGILNNADLITDPSGVVQQSLQRNGDLAFNLSSLEGGLTLHRDFDGDDHNLQISLSQDDTASRNPQHYTDISLVPAAPDAFDNLIGPYEEAETDFKGDYSRPMPWNGKLKAGWDVDSDDNAIDHSGFVEAASPSGPDQVDQSDHFRFRRTISALYTTYQQPIGKLTVLAGLRLEEMHIALDDETTNLVFHSDNLHLYPTLHVAYDFTPAQQLLVSYSGRVQEPPPQDFDPFRFTNGLFNLYQGNPLLRPQETQSFEAAYQYKAGGAFYLLTAYYKLNRGGVTDIDTDLGDGVLLDTQENLIQSRNAGLEFVANGHFTKTLSYSLSGNAYWTEVDGAVLAQTVTRSGTTLTGRASLNWQATSNDLVQVFAATNGKQITPQGFREWGPTVNFGYRHKIDDHLSLLFTLRDAFESNTQRLDIDTAALREQSETYPRDRAAFIGFTWSFGAGGKKDEGFDFGDPGGGAPH